ncbi:MAG: Flp family type IVb pilin [Gammaproteobacteria bacterium]|nr:Flp family type IVb pilin [Gammaproteobacteria bacterium]
MKHAVARFVREEEGVTAIEYGLIAGLIAVAIIAAVTGLGQKLVAVFQRVTGALP